MEKIPFTPSGLEKLKEELRHKNAERQAVIKAIAEAREHGDLSKMRNIMRHGKNSLLLKAHHRARMSQAGLKSLICPALRVRRSLLELKSLLWMR